jgi:two-component system, NarL family, nitrate/nitrite response regulator NarL
VCCLTDTALYGEALARVLDACEWADRVTWQLGPDLMRFDPAPDVILVMCQGLERVEWIRSIATLYSSRIIAVGLSGTIDEMVDCARAGASGYFFRDQSVEELRGVVLAAIQGGMICSPTLTRDLILRLVSHSPLAHKRTDTTSSRLRTLTERECEVLALITSGRSNKDIARGLSIDLSTVKNHVHAILTKLDVSRRGEAAAAYRN